ncbi:MAG: hypothetical protein NTW87_06205 [Planctomycetota bacterium]|nr:hypothetical protein [Planctomycetota bacterium]
MKVLRAWADEEKARAESLLMALPPAERHQAIALQKRPLRDFVELWFAKQGAGAQAAVNWLWSQPAADGIADFSGTLDEWAKQLREKCGLNVCVDARAPLVLSLPVPDKGESLRDYMANHLAAGEILASGIEQGQEVVLQQIGLEPAGPKPLTAQAALELPVFFLGAQGNVLQPLQEALSARGIQVVSPNAELKVNKMLLRTAVNWLARLLDRGVRVEGTIIELK